MTYPARICLVPDVNIFASRISSVGVTVAECDDGVKCVIGVVGCHPVQGIGQRHLHTHMGQRVHAQGREKT